MARSYTNYHGAAVRPLSTSHHWWTGVFVGEPSPPGAEESPTQSQVLASTGNAFSIIYLNSGFRVHYRHASCRRHNFSSLIHLIIFHYSNAKIWRLHHKHIRRTMTHIMGGQHPKATPAYTNYHGAAVSRYSHLAIAVLSFIRRGLASWSRGLAKSLLSFCQERHCF